MTSTAVYFSSSTHRGTSHGLRYVYNNGYVSKLKEAREGLSGTVYQDIQSMDARGNVTALRLGNGVDVYANYEADYRQADQPVCI